MGLVMKWEVGKKYEKNVFKFECLFVFPDGCCVGYWIDKVNTKVILSGYNRCLWKEYKEPQSGTVWINIYPPGQGSLAYKTRENADTSSLAARIACIEVPWVEGQGL